MMTSTRCISLLLLYISCNVEALIIRHGYHYHDDSQAWFKWHEEKASWHRARSICYSEGARLASPIDEDFKVAVEMFVNDTATRSAFLDPVYVGVHSTYSSDVWQSIEGIPIADIADHVEIINLIGSNNRCSVFESGALRGVDCAESYPFVCYKLESDVRLLNSCRTADTGYEYNQITGSCYKFHQRAVTWHDAYKQCYEEGAHLLIINSETEANIVLDFFNVHRHNTSYHHISLGLVDWQKKEEWYTVQGERIEDSGYMRWDRALSSTGNCGFMAVSNNMLHFHSCDEMGYFMCEKDMRSTYKSKCQGSA